MMTSSNGNIFRVTGHLCGEFTGHRWIPRGHKGQWRGALVFSLISAWINGWVNQSWGWWFETPSRPLWRHCYVPYRGRSLFFMILPLSFDRLLLPTNQWWTTLGVHSRYSAVWYHTILHAAPEHQIKTRHISESTLARIMACCPAAPRQ